MYWNSSQVFIEIFNLGEGQQKCHFILASSPLKSNEPIVISHNSLPRTSKSALLSSGTLMHINN